MKIVNLLRLLFFYNLLFSSSICKSQTVLEFTYDVAGNQILRDIATDSQNTAADTIATIEVVEQLVEQSLNNQFTVSPNPTADAVTLSWFPEISENITHIELVSLITNQRQSIAHKKINSTTLNLSGKPPGLYVILFHLKNKNTPVVQKKLIKY